MFDYYVRGSLFYIKSPVIIDIINVNDGEVMPFDHVDINKGLYCFDISEIHDSIVFNISLFSGGEEFLLHKNTSSPPFYFLNYKDYVASGYTWGKNRHKDDETNAFICYQAFYSTLPLFVKFSLCVVFCYKALELDKKPLIIKALNMANELLPRVGEISLSNSVREDRDHLFFSLFYVRQLILIYQGYERELVESWSFLYDKLSKIKDRDIFRISLINIVNIVVFISVYCHFCGDYKSRNYLVGLNLDFFKKAVSLFEGEFDIVHFKELSVPYSTVSFHQVLCKLSDSDGEFSENIQHHYKVKSCSDYLDKLLRLSIRADEKTKKNIIASFKSLDFSFYDNIRDVKESLEKSFVRVVLSGNSFSPLDKLPTERYGLSEDLYINIIRDLALLYEKKENYSISLDLMRQALYLRPNGPLIQKKINEYLKRIK